MAYTERVPGTRFFAPKLSEEQRNEIRELYAAGSSARELAAHYNVSEWTVYRYAGVVGTRGPRRKATEAAAAAAAAAPREKTPTLPGTRKVTPDVIAAIRHDKAAGLSRVAIAQKYGLSSSTVYYYMQGDSASPLTTLPAGFRPGQSEPIDGTGGRDYDALRSAVETANAPANGTNGGTATPAPHTAPHIAPAPAPGSITMRQWLLQASNRERLFLSWDTQFAIQQLETSNGSEPEFRVWFRNRERRRLRGSGSVIVGVLDYIGADALDQGGTVFFPGIAPQDTKPVPPAVNGTAH